MRILLIEDQLLVRAGLCALLSNVTGADVFEATNKSDALAAFRKANPDIVIISNSIQGSSAPELMKRLKSERPHANILILAASSEPIYAAHALDGGARGFISKRSSSAEFITAVRKVADGQRFIDSETAAVLAAKRVVTAGVLDQLTLRQVEILRLIGRGNNMRSIASHIGVSYKTIANTCSAIKAKLGLTRTIDLIRLAMDLERT